MMLTLALACGSAALAEVPAPIAMNSSALGGAALNQYTPGVDQGKGPNNIGLLIRTWGKVTFIDPVNKFFYIDDGFGRLDGFGQVGVRVSYDNLATGESVTVPDLHGYYTITGIISTVMIDTKIQPNVRPRRDSDVVKVAQL